MLDSVQPKRIIGVPFARGHDPRRSTTEQKLAGRHRIRTARSIARGMRTATIERLAQLRDQTEHPKVALEACMLILRYSDGAPDKNAPTEAEETVADAGGLAELLAAPDDAAIGDA